jgi:hypothetical protein
MKATELSILIFVVVILYHYMFRAYGSSSGGSEIKYIINELQIKSD